MQDPCTLQSPAMHPRVVVVDDDNAVRASLAFSLEIDGFDVDSYASAEEAAEPGQIADQSCLIVDYRLPGMDGLGLLAVLRERGLRVPAIIITSNPRRNLRQAIAEAGASLIEKPLLCGALTARVRSLIARPDWNE